MQTEKFYLSTGEEVKLGDVVRGRTTDKNGTTQVVVTVTQETIPLLKSLGIITTPKTSIMLSAVIERIAKRLGWKTQKVQSYLGGAVEIMPMAAFNILLREIAVMMDEKYPDHIHQSKEIYAISPLDGRIHKLCKAHIKNYRNFAAFRTIEDAKAACNILREPLKEMFGSDK